MTKDEALNIAIDYMNERLEEHDAKFQRHPVAEAERNNILADIEAVKEALAQPEHGWTPERIAGMARLKDAQDKKLAQPEQEPVGQLLENAFGRGQVMWFNKPKDESMLYTTPPPVAEPHKRKPLSDEEFRAILRSLSRQQGWDGDGWDLALKEAIEAAHGIKGEA